MVSVGKGLGVLVLWGSDEVGIEGSSDVGVRIDEIVSVVDDWFEQLLSKNPHMMLMATSENICL
jgi:hypothetical protein